jgi:hypothetical protein
MLSNVLKVLGIILLSMLIYGTSLLIFPQDEADEVTMAIDRIRPDIHLVQEDVKIVGTSIHARIKITNQSEERFPLYGAAIELKVIEDENGVIDVCENRPQGQIEPKTSKYIHFECADLVFLEGKDSQELKVEFNLN